MIVAAILPSLGLVPEIAVAAIPGDERVWVPQAAGVWFHPLLLNTVSSKIEMCRRHYGAVGLGLDYVDQFIR